MRKFIIDKGDYIDSREFSREECERFCELAVECGLKDKGVLHPIREHVFINEDSVVDSGSKYHGENNITAQFREFLDKEKGVKKFTKDDLKSEHNVTYRNLSKRIVFLDSLVAYTKDDIGASYEIKADLDGFNKDDIGASYKIKASLDGFNHDLTHREHKGMDIMRVTDRDGTVLFEREPEKVKLELEVTPEQAEAIRKLLNQ